MKKLYRGLLIFVVILIVLGIGAFLKINSLVKAGIVAGSSYATGVNTSLDHVKIGLFSGQFSLDDLVLDNPDGYESDYFFALGSGELALSLGSLMEDKVVIPLLALDEISMNLEEKDGKANYQVILDSLAKLSDPDAKPADADEKAKAYIIEELRITNIKVNASVGSQVVPIEIDQIVLKNIGSDEDKGVAISQVSGIVMAAIFESLVKNAPELLPGMMLDSLGAGLEGIGELGKFTTESLGKAATAMTQTVGQVVGEAGKTIENVAQEGTKVIEGAGKTLEDAGKATGEALEGLGKGLGNLLGGAKKEEPEKKD